MGLTLITFVLALVLSFTIFMVAMRPAQSNRNLDQRLVAIREPARADGTTLDLEGTEIQSYASRLGHMLRNYQFSKSLQTMLVHANSASSVGGVVIASVGISLGCGLAGLVFLRAWPLVAAAAGLGAALPWGLLRFQRARRLKAFNAALPEAIDLMARALRAGHSVGSLMELVAEQTPEPLAGEFLQVHQQQKFGLRFRDALLQLGERMPSQDLRFLITAILVQRETGGDLTEILDRAAHVIRERLRIQGEVRTYTAQGRLTGWILSLLPVALLLLINLVTPGYSKILFNDPTGQKLLYTGAVLIAIGALIIRKIVDIKA
jgi:tight adherence protein B